MGRQAALMWCSPEPQLQADIEGALEVVPEMLQTLLPIIHDGLHQLNEDVAEA